MRVAVLGGGIMGSGIAQICAGTGHVVWLLDVDDAALERARASISDSLDRFVHRERLTTSERDATLARIQLTTDLTTAVSNAETVIEAVPEQLDLKQGLLAETAELAPSTCLLATNTSQLSITKLAAAVGDASDRLVGMHFFNPPVLMTLVELIAGLQTSPETLDRAEEFARGLGRETVVCRKDVPGFITTRCAVILRLECLRMLEEGVASAEDIDKALRLGFNHPMGPLELGDLVGMDTFLRNADSLAEAHGERFRAPAVARNMVAAGRYGRKTGHGFYDYDGEGRRIDPPSDAS